MSSVNNLTDKLQKTANFQFSESDEKASIVFSKIQQQARKTLPPSFYSVSVMTHYEQVKKTQLYSILKQIPKGALHHCHIDCNQDKQFYKQHIINDPIIYLNQQKTQFRIGTVKQAQQNNWISMQKLRQQFKNEQQMIDFISNITMFNKKDHENIAHKTVKFWAIFEHKIIDFFTILYSLSHFKKYMKFICLKYIKNGYDRLQFRSMLSELNEYDSQGNLVKKHPQRKFTQIIDQVCEQINNQNNDIKFSLGVIFFGLKMFNEEQNGQIFKNVCELNWNKAIGVDLVQEQDLYGSLQPYNNTIDKVLKDYPHLNLKKVYHAGESRDPLNKNIQVAIKAGSVRIGHGINILHHLQLLPELQKNNICFQISPISNMLAGYRDDLRIGSASVLMGLGQSISINPDDPGKFGYQDSTMDYFAVTVSHSWGLKQLKLLGVDSINHSICTQEEKNRLISLFNQRWSKFTHKLLFKS